MLGPRAERRGQARLSQNGRPGRQVLTNILSNEGAATSATETIATAQQDSESLSTLIPRYQHAAQELADRRRQGKPGTDDLAAYVAELAAQIRAQAAKQDPRDQGQHPAALLPRPQDDRPASTRLRCSFPRPSSTPASPRQDRSQVGSNGPRPAYGGPGPGGADGGWPGCWLRVLP